MRSLLWRLTLSHLVVSLLAVALVALLTPPLFFRFYSAAEARRGQAIATGLARAAAPLLHEGARSPHLQRLITTSAQVLAAEVSIVAADDSVIVSSNAVVQPGRPLPAAPRAPQRLAEYQYPVSGGHQIIIRKPVPGWQDLLRAQRAVTGVVSLAAVVLALLLALASARAVSAPLVEMSRAAHELAEGNFAVSLDERGPAEVRSLATSMNHMAQSLASLDQLRRDFIASASHELRAPLTSIRGFLDALQDGTASGEEERRRCLQAASAEARRMTRLVEDLLQLSRLQAGVLEFQFAPTNLRQLVDGVLQTFESRLRERDVRAELQADEVPPVMADGERLVQALVNLLDNALRYAPSGSTIEVRVGRDFQDRPMAGPGCPGPRGVIVTVTDHGPGIPEADLPDIFERFHKADAARPVGDHGAGLGLAIAKEIVLRHGGEVFARNREEGGAEVGFWVPPTPPSSAAPAAPPATSPPPVA
jgi:signal transduction histidine kinase